MSFRILAPIAGAFAIVAGAVALIAPHGGSSVLDPVAQAAATTTDSGSAAFHVVGSINAAGKTIPIDGDGTVDMKRHALRMKTATSLPGLGETNVEEILSGTQVFVRVPVVKQWMKVDLGSLPNAGAIGQVWQSGKLNPADFVQALKSVSGSRVVGHGSIAGVPTTHYAGRIKLPKVAGTSSVPIDVWIDRDGRVRRESTNISGKGFGLQLTVEYSRFGVPTDTTLPAKAGVLDASSLLAALARGRG